jgi:hypothetical protein
MRYLPSTAYSISCIKWVGVGLKLKFKLKFNPTNPIEIQIAELMRHTLIKLPVNIIVSEGDDETQRLEKGTLKRP